MLTRDNPFPVVRPSDRRANLRLVPPDNKTGPSADPLSDGARQHLRRLAPQVLASYGAASVAGLLTEDWSQAVRVEAQDLRPLARRTLRSPYELYAGGTSLRSPARYDVATPGPELRALHADRSLRQALQEVTSSMLQPTRSAYLYYGPGDFMGLHTDVPECFLTVLTPTVGVPGPLTVFPTAARIPLRSLGRHSWAADGLLPGGRSVPLALGGLLLIYGHVLPHQRRPVEGESVVGVASLCFTKVQP